MGKIPTNVILFDSVYKINIKDLKKWGYLEPNQHKDGIITWYSNNEKTGSISIGSVMYESPHIELSYTWNGQQTKYTIDLVCINSNLGIGKIWYFLCPITHKRCRILYQVHRYFYHRTSFNGCMYESQTQSKYLRLLNNTFGISYKIDNLYKELYSKHFKRYYAGKPTKRFLKLKRQIDYYEKIDKNNFIHELLINMLNLAY
jgi:hypothetical protein